MTWLGFAFIALPLMVFTFFVMWYLIAGIKRLTGLSLEEIMMIEADDDEDEQQAEVAGQAGKQADKSDRKEERYDN
jgi:hypothetical protein